MLYNVLVGFVFAQLHYTTKRLLPFFFWMQPFLLFFYSAIYYLTPPVRVGGVCLYGSGGAVSFADEFHELVLRNRL